MSSVSKLTAAITARFTFIRYLLASLCALSGDMLLFLALLRLDVPPAAAAAAGYIGGLLLHWLISVRFVFTAVRRPTHGQRLGFVASAAVGLGITTGVIGALGATGVEPAVAKLVAIPVSFLSVYAIRKYGVFALS
jgi:putative flippase GtrA